MTNIISINRISQAIRTETTRSSETVRSDWRWATPSHAAHGEDTVELSQHAQWMQQLATLPPGRIDVINRVRSQLGAGTYETDHKLDIALERLAQDVI